MHKLILILLFFVSSPSYSSDGGFKLLFKGIRGRSSDYTRDIYIYLPPGFTNSHRLKYPVLYMHDGQNLFNPERATFGHTWRAEETLNQLIENQIIPPIIVVGIDNTPDRVNEYTHAWDMDREAGGDAKEYLDFIAYDLKRYIDHVFPTKSSSEFTGIMGSSLGGLVSLYAGAVYSDTFGLIGAMSPSVWWDNKSILKTLKSSSLPKKIYVDSGVLNGESPENTRLVEKVLRKRKFESLLLVIDPEGQHNEQSWARRLPGALTFLFGSTDVLSTSQNFLSR